MNILMKSFYKVHAGLFTWNVSLKEISLRKPINIQYIGTPTYVQKKYNGTG